MFYSVLFQDIRVYIYIQYIYLYTVYIFDNIQELTPYRERERSCISLIAQMNFLLCCCRFLHFYRVPDFAQILAPPPPLSSVTIYACFQSEAYRLYTVQCVDKLYYSQCTTGVGLYELKILDVVLKISKVKQFWKHLIIFFSLTLIITAKGQKWHLLFLEINALKI